MGIDLKKIGIILYKGTAISARTELGYNVGDRVEGYMTHSFFGGASAIIPTKLLDKGVWEPIPVDPNTVTPIYE